MQNLTTAPILLVDDEPSLLRSTSLMLRAAGFGAVQTLDDSRQVLPLLARQPVSLLLLDLTMPHLHGQEVLQQVVTEYPEVAVIIITATSELDIAVQCMQQGAQDYLVKPVEKSRFIAAVTRVMEMRALQQEVQTLKDHLLRGELRQPDAFSEIVTKNKAMTAIFQYVEAIAGSSQPVLISGETGTGKELIARAIHSLSGRTGEFVAVNAGGLDDQVFSDTLFGHKKGAFTGAEQVREGLIATAANGTLLLDEIGDLTQASQIKLLRLLQDSTYYPLGSDQPRRSQARMIVATHRDIQSLIVEGGFRKDLYYRLRGHHIQLPPLRERKDDLPALLDHFLGQAAAQLGKDKPTVPSELLTMLSNYHFPGNVRELESMVFDAVARHQRGVLSLQGFKAAIGSELDSMERTEAPAVPAGMFADHLPTLKEAEQYLIEQALQRAKGNQGIAASMLGLTRQALNKRLVRERNNRIVTDD